MVEPGPRVRLDAGAALFRRIVRGLATPGQRFPSGTACAAYADVEQTVVAHAGSRWLVVDIPRDSCGHYDRDLLALLAQARGSAPSG